MLNYVPKAQLFLQTHLITQRTQSIVSVINLSADLAENRAVTHVVCVCVCNFELFMAVKKHILGQRVGRQTVLRNPTMSRSTNTMSVPTGLPPFGPNFPFLLPRSANRKRWCYPVTVSRCLATLLLHRHMTPAESAESLIIFSTDLERYYWGSWARGGAVG